MKTKMLRASCIARGLVKKGGKRKLVSTKINLLNTELDSDFGFCLVAPTLDCVTRGAKEFRYNSGYPGLSHVI